jgi:hypothetical protein
MLKKFSGALEARPKRAGRTGSHHCVLLLISETFDFQSYSEQIDVIRAKTWEMPTPIIVGVRSQAGTTHNRYRQWLYDNKPEISITDGTLFLAILPPGNSCPKVVFIKRDIEEVKAVSSASIVLETSVVVSSVVLQVITVDIIFFDHNRLGAQLLEILFEVNTMELPTDSISRSGGRAFHKALDKTVDAVW